MSQVHGEANATPINPGGDGGGASASESKAAGKAPIEDKNKSSSSSSLGVPSDDNEDQDDNQEVQSGITSLGALEDALPIERGLSEIYNGKSKSFENLEDATDLEVHKMEKKEHPVNRKRRRRIGERIKKRGRFGYSDGVSSASSGMPHLPAQNEHQEDEDDGPVFLEDDDNNNNNDDDDE